MASVISTFISWCYAEQDEGIQLVWSRRRKYQFSSFPLRSCLRSVICLKMLKQNLSHYCMKWGDKKSPGLLAINLPIACDGGAFSWDNFYGDGGCIGQGCILWCLCIRWPVSIILRRYLRFRDYKGKPPQWAANLHFCRNPTVPTQSSIGCLWR